MKNKVVLWGANAQNEKVLIALELQMESSKVQLYTFPETIVKEEFVNKMMQEWRSGAAVEFPEGYTQVERELSVTENLLPDDLRAERPDLVTRAQTEWHFAVLSSKLNQAYRQELEDFKEKVAALTNYDGPTWDSLRGFWDKVQDQVRERNLWREHADDLRDGINVLFDDLKKLRSRVNDEFAKASDKIYAEMSEALEKVEQKIAAGTSKLGPIFDDLKNLQRKYRDAKMTNEHRNKLWDRLDGAFKSAKEKRFGPGANEGSVVDRHNRRLVGLNEAIKRMEESVRRDEEELVFQGKKIASTEGQLEAQIRKAKIKMVEERLNSKREKLNEMVQTRKEVDRQINSAKDKESKRAEKDAERKKFEHAKEQARAEIRAKATPLTAGEKQDSLFEAATTVLGEVLENALDTMKAVATVVGEKAEVAMEKAEEIFEKMEDKAEAMLEKVEDKAEVAMDKAEEMFEKAEDKAEVAMDKAEEMFEQAGDKVEEVVESFTTSEEVKEEVAEAPAALEEAKDEEAPAAKPAKPRAKKAKTEEVKESEEVTA